MERAMLIKATTALTKDNISVVSNAAEMRVYEDKVRDLTTYVEQLEDANTECLSATDAERLRSLW